MSLDSEDIAHEPPSSINPYEVLRVEKNATVSEIKSAYRKQALKNHPDKVFAEEKEGAHERFQEVAFAYAILSDERRRRRYDTTGRTEETLDLEDDDFNWTDFYREQWRDVITGEAIEKFKNEYKGSEEEKRDLLESYEECEGDMSKIFETVMLSNPLDDEERFREIIDAAIASGEAVTYNSYAKESKASRKRRRNEAAREEREAREMAREMGLEDKLFGDEDDGQPPDKKDKNKRTKKEEGNGEAASSSSLAALIMARQKDRAVNFLDRLEAKYTALDNSNKSSKKKNKKKQKGKRDDDDDDDDDGGEGDAEPPEEAFQRMAERAKAGAGKKRKGAGGREEEGEGGRKANGGGRRAKRSRKV